MRRVGARFLFLLPVSVGLSPGTEFALAQSAPSNVQALPPIVVSRTTPNVKRGRAQNAPRTVRAAPTLVVYPTTPISGSGIDIDKVPASVNIVDVNQIERGRSQDSADLLQKYVPGIFVNEVTGNPFQPNVEFAPSSPLLWRAHPR